MPKKSVTHHASPLFHRGVLGAGASSGAWSLNRRAAFLRHTNRVMTTAAPHITRAPAQPSPALANGTFSASAKAAAATIDTV